MKLEKNFLNNEKSASQGKRNANNDTVYQSAEPITTETDHSDQIKRLSYAYFR